MDIAPLKEAGLTDGEIKVYTALLELGSSTTGPIIEKSGIAKSIIYQILDKLMQKGLVSFIIKQKTKYFQAAQPNKILEYIEERESKLSKNKKKVEDLLPQLLLLKQSSPESEVQIYAGMKGIQTVHEHTYLKLKSGEEYMYLGIYPDQEEKFHLYWQRDHKRREKSGIICRLFFNQGTSEKILKNRNNYKGCEARFMPTDIKTPSEILVYKDTTAIIIQQKPTLAIEIINQDVADSFKAYFEEFWKKSKPFKTYNI
tara:strand:+ start:7927 stop:8697 length:771 start_codon:yes stop_codon:yes gene_type:complete